MKFFSKDNKAGIEYDEGRSEEDFVEYLNGKCGTHRVVGGGLSDKVSICNSEMKSKYSNIYQAGRIAALDALAAKFFVATEATRKSIYQEALTLSESAGAAAKPYIRAMEKVVNGSEAYLEKESKRSVEP